MGQSGGKAPAEQLEVVKKGKWKREPRGTANRMRCEEAVIERALWAKWERRCSSCDHKTAGGRRHQARADDGGFRCSACGVEGHQTLRHESVMPWGSDSESVMGG